MGSRINSLTEASGINSDDYTVIDGATSGIRKVSPSELTGDTYIFTSTHTIYPDGSGTMSSGFKVVVANTDDITTVNAMRIKAFLIKSSIPYPMIITRLELLEDGFYVSAKIIYSSTQSTPTSYSGAVTIVSPFEITNVTSSM